MRENLFNIKLFKRTKNKLFYLLSLFFLVLVFFVGLVKNNVIKDTASIQVEMSVSAIGESNLWVNDQSKRPITRKIISTDKTTYSFDGISEDINYLRFDPIPGVENVNIKIFKVSIKSPNGSDFEVSPEDISKWQIFNGKITELNKNHISLLSSKNIILVSNLPYKVHLNYPNLIHKLCNFLSELRYIYLLFYFSLIVSVMFCFKNQPKSFLWVLVLIPPVFLILSHYIASSNLGQIQTSKAVGLAAFSGKSLLPNSLFLYSMTFFVIIIAFLFAYKDKNSIKELKVDQKKIAVSFLDFLPYILIFIYLFPDMSSDYPRHSILWHEMLVPNWDSDNAVTWAYMIKKGLLPFKDFWYPYGFSYIFDYAHPVGKFLFAGFSFLFFSLFIFYLKALTRVSSFTTIFITLALLFGNMPENNQLIYPQPERHLLPFVLIFSYIYSRNLNSIKPLIIFWLLLSLCLLIEPSQVVYAAFGIGLVFCLDLLKTRKINIKIIFNKFLREFFFGTCFLLVIISILKFGGFLSNISDFYLEMGAVSSYMAIPSSLTFNFKSLTSLNFFLIFTPFFFLGVGLYKAIRNGNVNNNLSLALLACGAVGVMQIQKHSIRPIDWALFYSASIGTFLFLLLLFNENKLKINRYIKFNMFLLFFSYSYITGSLFYFSDRFYKFEEKLGYSIKSTQDSYRHNYQNFNKFAPNLAAYKDEKKLIEILSSKYKNPVFYSLPDNPILYLIANNNPPYQINGFNLSPIFEQQKIVNYLKKDQIEFIIIEPNKNYIDGFSYAVRLPLVYRYVAQNYIFDFETSRFMVFRLKKSSEIVDINNWKRALTNNVDLGFLIPYSKKPIAQYLDCFSECVEYLRISLPKLHENRLNLNFDSKYGNFKVLFDAKEGQNIFWLRLDRLWFYREDFKYHITSDQEISELKFFKIKSNVSLY